MTDTFIYFIQNKEYVKIGITNNVARRMSQLRVGSPFPMTLLVAIPGDSVVENQIHHMFREFQVLGEWFEYSDAIQEFVEACRNNIHENWLSQFFKQRTKPTKQRTKQKSSTAIAVVDNDPDRLHKLGNKLLHALLSEPGYANTPQGAITIKRTVSIFDLDFSLIAHGPEPLDIGGE